VLLEAQLLGLRNQGHPAVLPQEEGLASYKIIIHYARME